MKAKFAAFRAAASVRRVPLVASPYLLCLMLAACASGGGGGGTPLAVGTKGVYYGDQVQGETVTTLESVPYNTPMPLNDAVAVDYHWDTGEISAHSGGEGTITTAEDGNMRLEFSSATKTISGVAGSNSQYLDQWGSFTGLEYSDYGYWIDDSMSDRTTLVYAAVGRRTCPRPCGGMSRGGSTPSVNAADGARISSSRWRRIPTSTVAVPSTR